MPRSVKEAAAVQPKVVQPKVDSTPELQKPEMQGMRTKVADASAVDIEQPKRAPTKEEMHRAATLIARRWRLRQKEKKNVRSRRAVCNWNCIRSLCCFFFAYILTVFFMGFVGVASRELSILLLSVVPQIVIAYFAEQWYP